MAVWEHGTGTGCLGAVACSPRLTARAGTLRGALGATCGSMADCETSACSMGVCTASGAPDAGAADAGAADAGAADAGAADAGPTMLVDAGPPVDVLTPDAGAQPLVDAGVVAPPTPEAPTGCGCQGGSGGVFALLAAAMGASRRRLSLQARRAQASRTQHRSFGDRPCQSQENQPVVTRSRGRDYW